jgi:hypothetical protein
MNALMKIAMVNCKQASYLRTKKSFKAISFADNLRLELHTAICAACKSLSVDSKLIDDALDKIMHQNSIEKHQLSEEQREKISAALK